MPKRDYMNRRQQMFFQQRLLAMREKIEVDLATYRLALQSDERQPDDFDLASAEEDRRYLLRTIERNIGLLKKVDGALRRLATGDYGYCLESGEPIGIERLLARPT
ncbi:MAG: TraR/DksA C4-type zinc finger protein, partial [Alloalcanivorax xenomutans]